MLLYSEIITRYIGFTSYIVILNVKCIYFAFRFSAEDTLIPFQCIRTR